MKKNDPKSKPKTPSDNKTLKGKDKKSTSNIEEKKEEDKPYENEKLIERFIHVTTYSDSNSMEIIKQLFENINQKAFSLKSVKEIYTKELSEEERNNNVIDYISGIQLIDKEIRITILEGLTGKAMSLIKEKLPKKQMNSETFKIFSDKNILFEKRIYSKFDLSLKYIKLRETLNHILTTFDIYSKANKYRNIYNTFMNYGSILKCSTLEEISNSNLFPDAESLLILERKYADILSDEDMTGIAQVKKKKKRITVADLIENNPIKNELSTIYSGTSNETYKIQKNQYDIKESNNSNKSNISNKEISSGKRPNINVEEEKINPQKLKIKQSTNSRNLEYEEYLFNRKKMKIHETILKNKEYLKNMKRKINKDGHFCKPDITNNIEKVFLYSDQRLSSYSEWVESKRNEYILDKNHYYSYSNYGLNLSFPLLTNKNQKYLDYLENKRKWVGENGINFDRYSQPKREPFFFPKIDNIL